MTFPPDILMGHQDPIYTCALYFNNFGSNWLVVSSFYSICLDVVSISQSEWASGTLELRG